MKREKTKFIGVYKREGLKNNKPDTCYDITYKADNKKIWEKVGWVSEGYSEKLANDIRAERIRSIRHGLELPKQRAKAPFFKDVWEKYEAWIKNNKARAGRDDIYLYKNHIKAKFENRRLNDISSFDLERFKSELSKKGLSPASVKHCLVLIRQIYNKASAWGLYKGGNPIKGVKMPTLQNQRTRFLSVEEANILLQRLKRNTRFKKEDKELEDAQLHDMALLSLHTGLRAGEIFNLRGYDLDFENDIIQIIDPKNKQTRHAYMTKAVREMLKSRKPAKPESLVFPDKNGHKIISISKTFRSVVNELGLNDNINDSRQAVTFHTLRHSFASWLALQGESIITLKELLGHKSTTMTERYSHLIPDHKRKAVNGLETTFNGNKKNKLKVVK